MKAEPPELDRCPICGRNEVFACWVEEQRQFLVECLKCTTFTISAPMADYFRGARDPADRDVLNRLSRYLREAGDDDDREIA